MGDSRDRNSSIHPSDGDPADCRLEEYDPVILTLSRCGVNIEASSFWYG
jgi:hypothetical protein